MKINYIERTACDVCGEQEFQDEGSIRDFDTHLGDFRLIRCKKCGSMFTTPYPDAETLPNLYAERDSKNFDGGNASFFDMIKDILARREIRAYRRRLGLSPDDPVSFVDFGTGNGRYALAYKAVCPQAEVLAVDFASEPPAALTAEHSHVPYMHTPEFFADERKFEICYMRHVLEHVDNPLAFLRKMLGKLADGGSLILEVPNVRNGITRLFRAYSPSFYPPYHLHHFTGENLKSLLDSLSLSPIEYSIFQTEMPFMSNLLANMLGESLNNRHRAAGVLLHPIQMIVDACVGERAALCAILTLRQ